MATRTTIGEAGSKDPAESVVTGLSCPICDAAMPPAAHNWLYVCARCGFQRSSLRPRIEPGALAALHQDPERTALGSVRRANFERILDLISKHENVAGRRLLEVGGGYGWFLRSAEARRMETYAIDPDPRLTTTGGAARTLWRGYFPMDLPSVPPFDVIAFNDSFEHLPDVGQALAACFRLLNPGGILTINAPSSTGIFYRLGTLLDLFGISGPLERLWQKDFPSPHLSYFAPDQLSRLAERHGFAEIERSTLKSVRLRGLWSRIRCDPKVSPVRAAILWLGSAVLIPFSAFLPDISLQLFRKR